MSSIFTSLFLLSIWLATSPTFISAYPSEPANVLHARRLLQIKEECSEDFENKDYTIFTNKCKGPRYSKEDCCVALKAFACPYVDLINDEKTNCAATMFSYITVLGNYPPGLFANLCSEDKQGLACPETTIAEINSSGSVGSVSVHCSSVAALLVVSLIFHWFYFQF